MGSTDDSYNDYSRSESEDESEAERMPMMGTAWEDSVASRKRHTARSISIAAALLVSLTANAILLGLWLSQTRDLDAMCIKHTSANWSPIMNDIKLRYQPVRFDGSFIKKSIYLEEPSPKVDQAWSDLGIDFRTAIVPEERGAEAGIDPSAVKVRASQGGGYLTNVEVLHHLHCLNMIRQTLPWNVDYYRNQSAGVYENSEPIVRLHVDHCMDVVRQQLQCSSDVGMFGQRWIQRKDRPLNVFPIFDTVHTCRNFDDILEWAKTHQAFDGAIAEVRDDDTILDEYV